MRFLRFLGPALLVMGLAILAVAIARGEAVVYLVAVVPVVTGASPLALAGILLVFSGFFATFLFWPWYREVDRIESQSGSAGASETVRGGGSQRRWGGVVFVGPFPIVFGSDPQLSRWMLLAGFLLFVALLALAILAFVA